MPASGKTNACPRLRHRSVTHLRMEVSGVSMTRPCLDAGRRSDRALTRGCPDLQPSASCNPVSPRTLPAPGPGTRHAWSLPQAAARLPHSEGGGVSAPITQVRPQRPTEVRLDPCRQSGIRHSPSGLSQNRGDPTAAMLRPPASSAGAHTCSPVTRDPCLLPCDLGPVKALTRLWFPHS